MGVLILVLVEHTLGDFPILSVNDRVKVLILVLVEHTLGGSSSPITFFVLVVS